MESRHSFRDTETFDDTRCQDTRRATTFRISWRWDTRHHSNGQNM